MKKFLLGLVAGFILAAMASLIVVFAMIRIGDRRPSIPDSGILVLRLEGGIPEVAPLEIPLPFFEAQAPLTLVELWDLIQKAAKDPRVRALVIEPRGVGAGWAKLHEIREAVAAFRRTGKPVVAWLRNPGLREYYLATAAGKIYLTPEDLLDVKGFRAVLSFYRRTLDKIGVQFEVEHAGRYKDAADGWVRDSMSPETRQVVNSMLDTLYGHVADTIASSRGIPPAKLRALIDEGPFLAGEAKAGGLVDGLWFDDQVFDDLKKQLKLDEIRKINHRDYARASALGLDPGARARVALVIGEGPIVRWESSDSFSEETAIHSASFVRMLRQVGDDALIRGVVLRVNSPGGDAMASADILHEVRRLSKRKPTVISMSDLAASGGYYISMSGDPVIAYPNTVTGSIGVVFGKLNLKGLYEKLGVSIEVLKRGRNADIDATWRAMDDAGRRKLKEGIESTYQTFLDRVAEGRKKKKEEIAPLAEGRAWMGSQAKANGLVDELGGFDRAFQELRKKAGIAADDKLAITIYPRRRTVFDELFSSRGESAIQAAVESVTQTGIRRRVRGLLEELGLEAFHLELWSRGGIFALPPYGVRFE